MIDDQHYSHHSTTHLMADMIILPMETGHFVNDAGACAVCRCGGANKRNSHFRCELCDQLSIVSHRHLHIIHHGRANTSTYFAGTEMIELGARIPNSLSLPLSFPFSISLAHKNIYDRAHFLRSRTQSGCAVVPTANSQSINGSAAAVFPDVTSLNNIYMKLL